MDTKPLEALVVDQDAVDTERLAAAIGGIVGIDSKTGNVVLAPGFQQLKAEEKLLAILLGRLASELLGRVQDSALSVTELVEISGMPNGTVAPAIRRLFKQRRLVDQDEAKRYFVPRSKVLDTCGVLIRAKGDV